jgi:hypothetical protein
MTDKGDVLDLAAIDAKTGELSTPPLRFVDAALRLRFRLNVYELRRRVFGFFFFNAELTPEQKAALVLSLKVSCLLPASFPLSFLFVLLFCFKFCSV